MLDEAPSVFLVGCRGSGKSSVGRCLAGDLECGFADTDRMVESLTGTTIAKYFAEAGEPAFRDRESEALQTVIHRAAAGERLVVATGGGIVLRRANVAAMRASGVVVWLSVPAPVLRRRIDEDPATASTRPSLTGGSSAGEVEKVLAEREPLYRGAADLELDAGSLSAGELSRRIVDWLPGACRAG